MSNFNGRETAAEVNLVGLPRGSSARKVKRWCGGDCVEESKGFKKEQKNSDIDPEKCKFRNKHA